MLELLRSETSIYKIAQIASKVLELCRGAATILEMIGGEASTQNKLGLSPTNAAKLFSRAAGFVKLRRCETSILESLSFSLSLSLSFFLSHSHSFSPPFFLSFFLARSPKSSRTNLNQHDHHGSDGSEPKGGQKGDTSRCRRVARRVTTRVGVEGWHEG